MSRGAVVEGEADPQVFDRFRGEDGGERRANACAQVRDVELVVPCLAWVESVSVVLYVDFPALQWTPK